MPTPGNHVEETNERHARLLGGVRGEAHHDVLPQAPIRDRLEHHLQDAVPRIAQAWVSPKLIRHQGDELFIALSHPLADVVAKRSLSLGARWLETSRNRNAAMRASLGELSLAHRKKYRRNSHQA